MTKLTETRKKHCEIKYISFSFTLNIPVAYMQQASNNEVRKSTTGAMI